MGIKTYLNKKIYIFLFSKYIRLHFLKMINIGYMEYPPTSIGDIKDKKLKAHLKSILTLIDEITDKKISEIEESVGKFSYDKNGKLANLDISNYTC